MYRYFLKHFLHTICFRSLRWYTGIFIPFLKSAVIFSSVKKIIFALYYILRMGDYSAMLGFDQEPGFPVPRPLSVPWNV